MTVQLSLNILQESYDKSNRLYAEYRSGIDQIRASWGGRKIVAADTLTANTHRKLAALEQERRKNFSEYYAKQQIKCYPVEAIHVGTTRNGAEYTESELRRLAKSLSFVPLNTNHVYSDTTASLPHRRVLSYPANQSLMMRYDPILQGIFGMVQVQDVWANEMVQRGKITSVSIEQFALGRREGTGLVGTGLALLTSDVRAGDERARIYREVAS